MLPNFKTQSTILRECLRAEHHLELPLNKVHELVARMHNFIDYQSMLHSAERVSKQILAKNVVHVVTSADYFNGEDEVCYLLGQILNLQARNYFVVEARGYCRALGNSEPGPGHVIINPHKITDYFQKYEIEGFHCGSAELIAASSIFSEVLLLDHQDDETSKAILEPYIASRQFETGIVSTGEGKKWRMMDFIQGSTRFAPTYHISVSHNYRNFGNPKRVIGQIEEIRRAAPTAPIVAWVFCDDCASNWKPIHGRDQVIFAKESEYHDLVPVEGLGHVRRAAHGFFSAVRESLERYRIPLIMVPHFSGSQCFVRRELLPFMVDERDRVVQAIMKQMESLDLVE